MSIEKFIIKFEETIQWQDQKIHGVEIPNKERDRVVAGLIDLALEHEKSISVLVHRKLYGSVFALLRPLFEAYIRAVWIRYCASDDELEKFKENRLKIRDLRPTKLGAHSSKF